ncbi:MAG TPA: hypothetical protein VN578_00930 [Candidatus Binatia bacterium]|nr:hypothetical protein [Candidatus Binatia bacterium]
MSKARADRTASLIKRVSLTLSLLGIGLAAAWATGILAGWPALPAANKTGAEDVFPEEEGKVLLAITNALGGLKYSQMMLEGALGNDWLVTGWHPTSGFLLLPAGQPVAWIPTWGPIGKRRLPYLAWFHITTAATGTNQTKVTVHTVLAQVVDGITLGPCGLGSGAARVTPVRREEEKVLRAISEQIPKTENGEHSIRR